MKRAVALRHLAFEDLGILADILEARGYTIAYQDAGVSDLAAVTLNQGDALIILGGPIGAYQESEYPFLVDELRLIESALKAATSILGICLGAQLLARALGARVYPGPQKEIGIAPVDLTPEGRASCLRHLAPSFDVLHWHGDTFDLPAGATRLASTSITPNQAFSAGASILGVQFHIEADPAQIERWLIGHTGELAAAAIDVPTLRRDLSSRLPDVARGGRSALAEWLDALSSSERRRP
jgi:GMP synthase (glutamine-hydrolysing)